MIFLKGLKVTPAPLAGIQGGSVPCVETFVFDELKINNFRPFFSPNFLKICLKITKKIGRPYNFEGGKNTPTPPPPPHTPKIIGAYLLARPTYGPMAGFFKSI